MKLAPAKLRQLWRRRKAVAFQELNVIPTLRQIRRRVRRLGKRRKVYTMGELSFMMKRRRMPVGGFTP